MGEQCRSSAEQRLANLTALKHEVEELAARGTCGKPSITIRPCRQLDLATIHAIINDAAEAYRGVIPADCWKVPYMSLEELRHAIAAGVMFWGCEKGTELAGVIGIQDIMDVTLIRHAYVRTAQQNRGIGGKVLAELMEHSTRPMLVGTWAAAEWAVRFYQRHGFRLVSPAEKDRLLRTYWSIPDPQIETSVVLADERWWALRGAAGDCQPTTGQSAGMNSFGARPGDTVRTWGSRIGRAC